MDDLIKAQLRKVVEDEIERLIAVLDHLDGDVDREDGDVDCCEAYDDRPGWCLNNGLSGPGDDDDAEDDGLSEGVKFVPHPSDTDEIDQTVEYCHG